MARASKVKKPRWTPKRNCPHGVRCRRKADCLAKPDGSIEEERGVTLPATRALCTNPGDDAVYVRVPRQYAPIVTAANEAGLDAIALANAMAQAHSLVARLVGSVESVRRELVRASRR